MSAATATVTKKTETKPRVKKVKSVETPVETPVSVTQPPAEVDTEAPIKEKKERQPRLPEKFGKYIQFAYWFMKKYNSETPKVDETEFLNAIAFYGTVDEQTSFVESFIADAKENKKEIRKNIVAHKKAAMPKKERKPREKKPKLDADGNEIPPKEKKPRAKKATKEVGNTQDELINELLRRANSTDVPTEVTDAAIATVSATATATATVTDKPVKEKKPRAKQETKSKPVKEAKPVKEKTAKKSNDKKVDEDVQITQPTQTNDDQDDEEVDADLVQIDGKNYYLDAQNVLYDVDTQDPVGRFDKNSNSMTPI
jgi:hypothetical protein